MAVFNSGLNIIAPDISGKEDKSNKVTAWSSTTTDEHYPSEKLVKGALDGKAEKSEIEASVTTNSLTAGAINSKGTANIGSEDNKFGSLFVGYINNKIADRLAYVNVDGVMEVGGYIDFHKDGILSNVNGDFTCRMEITDDNKLKVGEGIYGAVFN